MVVKIIKSRVCQVMQSLKISSFMEKKAQLAFHKQVILIRAASKGLISLRGVLIIHSFFCFTLRTMFNLSFFFFWGGGGGGGGEFKNSIFFFKNPTFVSPNLF